MQEKGYARGLEDGVVHGVLGDCLAFQEHHQLQPDTPCQPEAFTQVVPRSQSA